MNLPPTEEEHRQQLIRECHEIAIRPSFGNRLVIKFRNYGHVSTTLTVPARAVTIHGDGRVEFHNDPGDPK